jgi:hypothetical protein
MCTTQISNVKSVASLSPERGHVRTDFESQDAAFPTLPAWTSCAEVKPDNFLLGLGRRANQAAPWKAICWHWNTPAVDLHDAVVPKLALKVNLIDFGLSKKSLAQSSPEVRPHYGSSQSLQGIEIPRRKCTFPTGRARLTTRCWSFQDISRVTSTRLDCCVVPLWCPAQALCGWTSQLLSE